MSKLIIKPKDNCRWDAISLGEIMIRMDPGDLRIKTARNFRVWEGGGEYNVTRGLSKCFGKETAVVTGIVRNEIGHLLLDLIHQGGVNPRYIKWYSFDGIGKDVRVGLNFTEKGFGIRGALGVSDRANSAASKLKPEDIDWEKIFKKDGTRWFHTGGIFAALSDTTPQVVMEAAKAAKKSGTIVSYDLNYRASLWKSQGGPERAIETNREIAQYVDVMIGNEEDFTKCLGLKVKGVDKNLSKLDPQNFHTMIKCCMDDFPNLKAVATTLREVKTATVNGWSAILYYDDQFYQANKWNDLEIYDRVGGGDSFASGLIYGLLKGMEPDRVVEYGAAHGALAMTTPGDTTMASLSEVEKVVGGGGARVDR
ncbi:MAG: sugar kinase [Actinomycetia bacterium]|nr:sugar kinase [Actinomycetes bacterium]